MSHIRPLRDHRTLLHAAALLRQRGVRLELHLAGHDTTGGAMQRTDAARTVAEVTRWHGVLGSEALHALMCECDLLLHTSLHEAGPLAVLEAAVVRLLGDEPRRLRLAREAQRRAVSIDADFTAASFERLYADVLARRRR